ncbi:MAG: cation:proton antiporter [Candidatus Aegiribacteria sp.]|nr:cation:proton antiporter [Candidatus Aegiribacteria sp.]
MAVSIIGLVGIAILSGLYAGKFARKIGLPSLIGFMLAGAILGVSLLKIFNVEILEHLSFIPDIALGFVAFSIGSELNLNVLKRLGKSLTAILLCETLFTFALVTLGVLIISGGDWPMALIFGAMAPATAPAGTVAVLQEYKAKGNLTQALYAVVGFDDGIAVLIFGFASALSKSLLSSETGGSTNVISSVGKPALEIVISIAAGLILGIVYTRLIRLIRSHDNIPALTFGFVCVSVGLALTYGFSPILTPMAMGFVLSNTSRSESGVVANRLRPLMPLIFILFFFIAGAHLNLGSLPSLGLLGLVYIITRSAGKVLGAGFGARIGKAPSNIRKYLGIGILSQAGVAIGLSIAVAQQFSQMGTHASEIGIAVITTVTATCIIFEIIGPIMAKYALKKAGEIPE